MNTIGRASQKYRPEFEQGSGGILARQKSLDTYEQVRVGLSSLSHHNDNTAAASYNENLDALTARKYTTPAGGAAVA